MMKEMRANEIMKMFENQNVVNRADFTFEEYLEQLTSFQKIVSSCVYEGDDSYRLSDSITKLQQLIRSKGIKDDPFVKKAMDEIKEVSKELAIIMAGKRGEGRIEYALSFVERPDLRSRMPKRTSPFRRMEGCCTKTRFPITMIASVIRWRKNAGCSSIKSKKKCNASVSISSVNLLG